MKTIQKLLLGMFVGVLLLPINAISQNEVKEYDKEEFKPVYLSITTMEKCKDADMDFSEWMALEKEFYEKVTLKNDLIIGSGVYYSSITPEKSRVKIVTIYKNWEDIEKATLETDKLVEKGWPKEEARRAFFKKQSSFFVCQQRDEIYMATPYADEVNLDSNKPLVFYLKGSKKGDGTTEFNEYYNKVNSKRAYVKGYFTHVNKWGTESNDAKEVFVYNSFKDVEDAFNENHKLISEHWPPSKDKANEILKGYAESFKGDGNLVYTNIPELIK